MSHQPGAARRRSPEHVPAVLDRAAAAAASDGQVDAVDLLTELRTWVRAQTGTIDLDLLGREVARRRPRACGRRADEPLE